MAIGYMEMEGRCIDGAASFVSDEAEKIRFSTSLGRCANAG